MSVLESRPQTAPGSAPSSLPERSTGQRRARDVHPWLAPGLLASAVWLLLVVVAAFAPGLLSATDPYRSDGAALLQAPSTAHWFGTDQIGRDLYSRVVHGAALSLKATLIAVGVGVCLGALVGLAAGAAGGWLDAVLMRAVDVLLAIPSLLLSLAIITVLGFGTVNVAIAVGFSSVAGCARIMRSEVLRVRQSSYVEAATSLGVRRTTVLLRHVLPNSAGPVLVLAALDFGTAILAVSSLSFLGYGAKPPTPEWGSLVATGRDFLGSGWWLTTLPGLVVVATVLAANRIARALERSQGEALS
jgi:peptide/nickel transport system permease protein